jgi:hypothetical protein
VATQLAAHWDVIRGAYLTSVVNPTANARMARFMDDMASPSQMMHHHG